MAGEQRAGGQLQPPDLGCQWLPCSVSGNDHERAEDVRVSPVSGRRCIAGWVSERLLSNVGIGGGLGKLCFSHCFFTMRWKLRCVSALFSMKRAEYLQTSRSKLDSTEDKLYAQLQA